MFDIIIGIVVLTIAISMFVSLQTAAVPKNNVLLNTTLPPAALENPEVLKLAKKYKKTNLLILVAALIISPVLVFTRQISWQVLLIALWTAAVIILGSWVLSIYSNRLRALKQKNQWFVGPTHTVAVDTEVSRYKAQLPVSPLWFIPSVAIGLVLLGLAARFSVYPGLAALAGVVLHYLLYRLTARSSARAPSEDTKTNLAWTKVALRWGTGLWVILATAQTILILLLTLTQPADIIIVAAVSAYVLFTLANIVLSYGKIRRTQNLLLTDTQGKVRVDEDYYWQGGNFYNNPQDRRALVEKRIGYGYTLNIATPLGKIAYYGLIIGVPVLLLTLFLVFISFDTADFAMTITSDQVEIHAPLYGYQFPTGDIQSVTTVTDLPGGTRTNGAATSQYNLGNFRLTGYGQSKVYVYKDQPPYIVIELPDLHIFFNARDSEQTREYYELLLENMQ